ncbi:MAG: bis(5'-nucleosyl)-tetraphosphatase (symmetrical) YqeK [Bacilli bacterium]
MNLIDINRIDTLVQQKLLTQGVKGEKRYRHSLSVAQKMKELCQQHHCDCEESMIHVTGIIHDYAKFTTLDEYYVLSAKYPELIEKLQAPKKTLHALCGPYVIMEELNINNPMILDAVRYHTTGHPHFSVLGELLFVADFIEDERVGAVYTHVRQVANHSLKQAVAWALHYTINHIQQAKQPFHPMTMEAYLAYKKYLQEDLFEN